MGQMKPKAFPVFNSPFELGLRMVYLLNALGDKGADLQKLVLLDYAIVYSADLNGPPSLHTPLPFRGGELLSRRELIEQGLYLMSTRGLVSAEYRAEGINYVAGDLARSMVHALTSPYMRDLEARCEWVSSAFGSSDSAFLMTQFAANGHLWGAELESVSNSQGDLWAS